MTLKICSRKQKDMLFSISEKIYITENVSYTIKHDDLLNMYSNKDTHKTHCALYRRCLFKILEIPLFFFLPFSQVEKQNHGTHINSQIIQRCVFECDRHLNVFICSEDGRWNKNKTKNVRFKWIARIAKLARHHNLYTETSFFLFYLSL